MRKPFRQVLEQLDVEDTGLQLECADRTFADLLQVVQELRPNADATPPAQTPATTTSAEPQKDLFESFVDSLLSDAKRRYRHLRDADWKRIRFAIMQYAAKRLDYFEATKKAGGPPSLMFALIESVEGFRRIRTDFLR